MVQARKERVAITVGMKKAIFGALAARLRGGKLPNGTMKEVGQIFGVDPKTVSRLWHSILPLVPGYQVNAPLEHLNLSMVPDYAFATKFHHAGRNPKHQLDDVLSAIKAIS